MTAGDGNGQDVELNLAPIIDCFTVLITYLLTSASFLSLTILEVGVAASGRAPASAALNHLPPLTVSLIVKQDGTFDLKLSGGKKKLNKTVAVVGTSAFPAKERLVGELVRLQREYPELKEINIAAEPDVMYREVVTTIEAVKAKVPKIFLMANRSEGS